MFSFLFLVLNLNLYRDVFLVLMLLKNYLKFSEEEDQFHFFSNS